MIATVILLLHLMGFIPAEDAVHFLALAGILLIISEIFVVSFGVIALNGLISLFIAYALYSGQNTVGGIPIDWPFLFGIAFVEILLIIITVMIYLHYRNKKITTGIESMVGARAEVVSWDGQKGSVRIQGENWQARSPQKLELRQGDPVEISEIDNLTLVIKRPA